MAGYKFSRHQEHLLINCFCEHFESKILMNGKQAMKNFPLSLYSIVYKTQYRKQYSMKKIVHQRTIPCSTKF